MAGLRLDNVPPDGTKLVAARLRAEEAARLDRYVKANNTSVSAVIVGLLRSSVLKPTKPTKK